MRRQQLLTVGGGEACAGCETELADTLAWWDADTDLWTCTECVPTDESTRHSVAHGYVRSDRNYRGLF